MEAASEKKKRGRPSIDEQHDGFVQFLANTDTRNMSHRAHVNLFYRTSGVSFVTDHRDSIPHHDTLIQPYKDSYIQKKVGVGVLEQLGRMIEQDRYAESDVLQIAVIASDALYKGLKAKEVEQYIRRGRVKNIWTWETEAATKSKQLSDDDLQMIHMMLSDYKIFAEDSVISGCEQDRKDYYLAVTKVLPDLLVRIEEVIGDNSR